jgi:N-acetylneuraminic acid mutarotase
MAMDDWFFTPPLGLVSGNTYRIRFWFRNAGSYPEKMEVKWGSAANSAGMTSSAIFDNAAIQSATYAEGTGEWTAPSTGIFYLGFHGYSDADEYYLCVDDVTIEQVVPNDVGVLSVSAPNGNSYMTTSDVAPSVVYKNFGSASNSFDIQYQIRNHATSAVLFTSGTQTLTVAGVTEQPYAWAEAWAAPHDTGTYDFVTWTTLGTDANPANDTLVTQFIIGYDQYDIRATMPAPRLAHALCYNAPNNIIYLAGGGDGSSYNANFWSYDPAGNAWYTYTDMPGALRWAGMAADNGKVYVVGGIATGGVFNPTIYIFDIAGISWTTGTNFTTTGIGMPGVVAHNGYIYKLGGYTSGSAATADVEYYDPAGNSWGTATSMPANWCWGGCTIIGDRIYLIGGYDGAAAATNIIYGDIDPTDPSTISWSTGPALPEANCIGSAGAMGTSLFMAGGLLGDLSTFTNHVWRYDIPLGQWFPMGNMPTTRGRGEYLACRTSTKGGEFFIMGGDTSGGSWIPSSAPLRYSWVTPTLVVSLTSFTASPVAGEKKVAIAWSTASETGSYQWILERSTSAATGFAPIATVGGSGNSNDPKNYSITDQGSLMTGQEYYYRLVNVDLSGARQYFGPARVIVARPSVYGMSQSFPNPARNGATIRYQLKNPGMVSLKVYNLAGQLVNTLVSQNQKADYYAVTWNGRYDNGSKVAAGVYVYRLQVNAFSAIKKAVILK